MSWWVPGYVLERNLQKCWLLELAFDPTGDAAAVSSSIPQRKGIYRRNH